jgi:hypothetical protein
MRAYRPKEGLLGLTTFALLTALTACGGGAEEASSATEQQSAEAPAPTLPVGLSAEMRAAASKEHLAPNPRELQSAMTKAGISASLASLVPEREMDMSNENKDHVAVRTGVVLADLLLTVSEAEKADIVSRFKQIRAGLTVLKAGDDLPREIDDLIERIEADALSGTKLLFELDHLRAAVIPEIGYEADWTLPMLQAGAWLEGAHLISQALGDEPNDAGIGLLKQPEVVAYFLEYVQKQGEGRAESAVLETLEATLQKIKTICDQETMSAEDIKAINESTGVVLDLLLKRG